MKKNRTGKGKQEFHGKERNNLTAAAPVSGTGTYLKYGFVIMEHVYYRCPACGNILNAGPGYSPGFCGECGQKISFDGIEWKEDRELGYADRRCADMDRTENEQGSVDS